VFDTKELRGMMVEVDPFFVKTVFAGRVKFHWWGLSKVIIFTKCVGEEFC
jgi:hypothetical protein